MPTTTPSCAPCASNRPTWSAPAGYISMDDTEATELVQRGTARDADATSLIDMAKEAPGQTGSMITEKLVRKFWIGYQQLMGL